MQRSNEAILRQPPHLDAEVFRAAIEYTSRTTGFRMDLIEKDYFCSIALACLYAHDTPLIFKGGTCLNKVHVGFYRLSEDLDFSIHAIRHRKINLRDPDLLNLARLKLNIPDIGTVYHYQTRIDAMRKQLTTELQPVLRPADYAGFDFDKAAAQLLALSEVLQVAGK